MKKIMLLTIFTLSSMPMISLSMAPFVASKLGKRTLIALSALGASKLNSVTGRDYVEENLPEIPAHPSYPYNEEGIAFEQLCSQAASINDQTDDYDKKQKARLLAENLHDMLPGSGAIQLGPNILRGRTKPYGGTYPFKPSPAEFWMSPGHWNDYRYSIKKDAPWYNTSSNPLKPEDVYQTQIPGEQQLNDVKATIAQLSAQEFEPARKKFEQEIEKISALVQEEENKYFWQRDEQKMQRLQWHIKENQRLIEKCAFLGSSQEELVTLKIAAHVRQNFLQKHMANHVEWKKEKEKIEKKREEIRNFVYEKEKSFAAASVTPYE